MLFVVSNFQKKILIADLTGNIFHINQNKPELWQASIKNISPYSSSYYLLPTSSIFFTKQLYTNQPIKFSAITDKTLALSDTSCIIKTKNKLFYHAIGLQQAIPLNVENQSVSQICSIDGNPVFTNEKNDFFSLNISNNQITQIQLFDENNQAFIPPVNKNSFFWEPGMDKPIIINNNKAWLLHFKNNRIIAELIAEKIPSDAFIRYVQYSEKNKSLFIGTDSKGLIVINSNRVESKKRKTQNSISHNAYYSQIELANGNILTNEADIIGEYPQGNEVLPVKTKFSFHTFKFGDSVLWYSEAYNLKGDNFLNRYNFNTGLTKAYPKIIGDYLIKQIGTETYIAHPRGIGKIVADTIQYIFKYPKNSELTLSFAIEEIKPNLLAVATCSGLITLNLNNFQVDTILKKPGACVRSIWKYKDYVFLGTYGSCLYMEKQYSKGNAFR